MMKANFQRKLKRFEMKFRIDAEMSESVKTWARDHLGVDENCNAKCGDTYDINTLYLDTPEFDILNGTGRVGRAKHRVRRYGNEDALWLETKRKKKMVVRKNRTALHESDFAPQRQLDPNDVRCDDWFVQRIAKRQLQPAAQIVYRRFARTSMLNGQALRLTIDSSMFASAVTGWRVPRSSPMGTKPQMAFGDCEILELKFNGPMPHLFKMLLQEFTLPMSGFSKYRTAMQTLDCDSPEFGGTYVGQSVEFGRNLATGDRCDSKVSIENA